MKTGAIQVVWLAVAVALAVPACSNKGAGRARASRAPTTIAPGPGFAQWATKASATTSWGAEPSDAWSANRATGEPDVSPDSGDKGCGDIAQAWASAEHNTVDTLVLGYSTSVKPTGINIYETNSPGAVSKVEVSGPGGKSKVVYLAEPAPVDKCPRVLEIEVSGVEFAVDTVSVTVNQAEATTWAEIDAVQLVGEKS